MAHTDRVTDLMLKRGAVHDATDPLPQLEAECLPVAAEFRVALKEPGALLGKLVG